MKIRVEVSISEGLCRHILAVHLSEGRVAPTKQSELKDLIRESFAYVGYNKENYGETIKEDREYANRVWKDIHG